MTRYKISFHAKVGLVRWPEYLHDARDARIVLGLLSSLGIAAMFQEVEDDLCEHGVVTGDWCPDCNREYKTAAADQCDEPAEPGGGE